MVFSGKLEQFRSLGNSHWALMRSLLGDFDFEELRSADTVMGPLFFVSYVSRRRRRHRHRSRHRSRNPTCDTTLLFVSYVATVTPLPVTPTTVVHSYKLDNRNLA